MIKPLYYYSVTVFLFLQGLSAVEIN